MSVIIRLQNLPWNANALDIRRFFVGLAIPDGGVHIIGGEKGDAFIAFGTDEDARQAMMKDGGRINSYAVKLLLSSKTEMQNVIAAAKGSLPPMPAASNIGLPPPVGLYDRPIPPVGGAPVPYVGGNVGGDVTGSGQGLRSSTGVGSFMPPYGSGGYPGGSGGQVLAPPQQQLPMVRLNEQRALPPAPVMPPAGRSIFDARPPDRPPVPANLPPPVPMQLEQPGMRPPVPGLPPAGAWTASQLPMSRDVPPPDFRRPADIPGNTGAGYSAFNPNVGREPLGLDNRPLDATYPKSGPPDTNYARNGHAYGVSDGGRGFIPGAEVGRNLSVPPPDVGRDFPRAVSDVPLGRPGEKRDMGRYVGDRPAWAERDAGRLETGSCQGWMRGGRDVDDNSRREFPRPDADRGMPGPDRWLESRNMGPPDRGPRDPMPNDSPLPRPGAVDLNDRYGHGRPPSYSEGPGSRFMPDSGHPARGAFPDSRPGGEARPAFAHPDPGRPFMEEPLRRPPPVPEQQWTEDQRAYGHGLPPPRFDGRPPSPPRDHQFPASAGFHPRNEPWHDERRDFDQRQAPGSGRDLCVCATNFPRTFNYREVRQFFRQCEIPRDGVKLINDRTGMRTGVVFIQFASVRGLNAALEMHGKVVNECRINIERCSDQDFDMAVDSAIPKNYDRSRSPRNRKPEENSNISYFVVKKLPAKTTKDDIRKFFGKFRITPDGGPFFELAYDNSKTGNALVAVDEKDFRRVMTLNRTTLNGALIDVVNIHAYEFQERSRRARQSGTGDDAAHDIKAEGQEIKSEEAGWGGEDVGTDGDRRRSGSSPEGPFCVELRGIPYTASSATVQDFFHDIRAEAIHIVYNREHRATGISYIEFSSLADQKKAVEKHKQMMSHRVVEIRALSKSAMVAEYNKHQQRFGGAPMAQPKPRMAADRPKSGSPVFLSMQNLHVDAQLEDILEFLSGYHPIVESIKLQYKEGKPTGDGLVAFQSQQEAELALRGKNRHTLLGKPVTLSWSKN